MPFGKRASRREQRKKEKTKTQSERLIQMKIPTSLAVTEKKERQINRDLNETIRHIAFIDQREKRVRELTTMIGMMDDIEMKAELKRQLYEVIKNPAPQQKDVLYSGELCYTVYPT